MCSSSEHPDFKLSPAEVITPERVRTTPADRPHVLSKYCTRFRKALEKAIINHCLRTGSRFLRWLKKRHQRPSPCISIVRHQCGRSNQPRYVHVMAAGMHHRYGFPILIRVMLLAYGRPVASRTGSASISARSMIVNLAVTEHTDYSRLANASRYFVTSRPEAVRGNARCPVLLHR